MRHDSSPLAPTPPQAPADAVFSPPAMPPLASARPRLARPPSDTPRAPPPLSPALLAAYERSDFQVCAAPLVHLRIGARCQPAAALLAAHQAARAILFTAWNPFSEQCEFAENEWRQHALFAYLLDAGLTMLPALGVDPTGSWPAEESVFVFGIDATATDRLLERFEQNAAVVVDADGTVGLQFHPLLRRQAEPDDV